MTTHIENAFTRYLAAKKTVDDRALNAHVWSTLVTVLPSASSEWPLRILEVGAGIGTMVERLLERDTLTYAHYQALDEQVENIRALRQRVPLSVCGDDRRITIEAQVADAHEFVARPANRGVWDVVIAHAVLDLWDLPTSVPALLACLRPGGVFYFTIVFDGATIFQPEIDPVLDPLIEALYHRTMDDRLTNGRPSGDSRSGRHLIELLRRAGASILAAGSSDWVVFASADGRYPADEAYFLHFIINTVDTALCSHPHLDPAHFAAWIAERHAQIDRGELVYIAHQLDFVGRGAG